MRPRLSPATLLFLLLVWLCPPDARAADDDFTDPQPLNYAFAAVIGSGIYSVNGRTAAILRVPFSFRFRDERVKSFGTRLRLPVTVGLYDRKDGDEASDPLPEDAATLSVVPGFEIHVPLVRRDQWVGWKLIPFVYAGPARDFGGEETAWVGSYGVSSRAEFPVGQRKFVLWNRLQYARNFGNEPLDDDDFALFRTDLEWIHPLRATWFGQETGLGILLTNEYYFNTVEIERLDETFEIRVRWEVGVTYGPAKPLNVSILRVPRIGLSYRFGQGVSGAVLTIRFRY